MKQRSIAVPKVLFLVRRIGPYHHARFQAASSRLNLTVAETRSSSQEYPWEFTPNGNYKIIRFPGTDENGIRGEVLLTAIIKAFESSKPDVVVTTGWADPEYHRAVIEASQRNIPCVFVSDSRAEDEPRRFYKEFVKRLIVRAYSASIVAGTASRKYAQQLGVDPTSIFSPWDVVDNDYFRKHTSKATDLTQAYFLCVSRFIPKKNLLTLLIAFSSYREQGGQRKLVLVGDGELKDELWRQVERMELIQEVEFHGFVQYENLPPFFSGALCLIIPSLSDQWGLVVNEAMASGLPILASKACGCTEDIVEHGKNGFHFDPASEDSITNAMLQMDKVDQQTWESMRTRSLHIIDRYKPADFAEGLVKAVNHAMKKKLPKPFGLLHQILSGR